jgi:type I restriction enzyme S subunit
VGLGLTFREVKLSDIALFKNGKKKTNEIGEIPVYGGNGIFDYTNKSNHSNIIIIGRVGAYCGSVHYEPQSLWVSDNAIAVKNIKGVSNIKYLKYLLQTLQLNKRSIGTSQPLLTQSILKDIKIKIPSLKKQEEIAHLLSSFDNKIKNNNTIIANLEEQAQTVFKSWFVDFEPFQDDEFVDSESGLIPKNGKCVKLDSIADIIMGVSPKSETYNNDYIGLPLLNGAADFNEDDLSPTRFTSNPLRVSAEKDWLLCIRGTIGNLAYADGEYAIGRGVSAIRAKDNIYNELIYYYIKYNITKLKSNATGSVISGLSKTDLTNIKIFIPKESRMIEIHNFFSSIQKVQRKLKQESAILTSMRDLLLPKLISGEIKI